MGGAEGDAVEGAEVMAVGINELNSVLLVGANVGMVVGTAGATVHVPHVFGQFFFAMAPNWACLHMDLAAAQFATWPPESVLTPALSSAHAGEAEGDAVGDAVGDAEGDAVAAVGTADIESQFSQLFLQHALYSAYFSHHTLLAPQVYEFQPEFVCKHAVSSLHMPFTPASGRSSWYSTQGWKCPLYAWTYA